MELNIQTKFAQIYSNFCNECHQPKDIGILIELARTYKKYISNEAMIKLLQIPLCVLNSQVEIKNINSWVQKNGDYFAGNCSYEPFHSKFKSKDFDLETIYDYLSDIVSDESKFKSDFYLRNPEVTLRDYAEIKQYSTFKESGKIYAKEMEAAFAL